jgi:hypothetical protein
VEKALIEAHPGMIVTIEMLTSAQESLQEQNGPNGAAQDVQNCPPSSAAQPAPR